MSEVPPAAGADDDPDALFDLVATRIERHGPLPFDEVMRLALYEPTLGFYSRGGAAGRRGDFITSVEVGPLFGAVVARALDTWWDDLGRPDPFVVIEAAAGIGTLARAVLHAAPACTEALTYVLVEQSAQLRARHAETLPLTAATHALPPRDADDEPTRAPATGPRLVSLAELPRGPHTGVVLANELLDNLPVALFERAGERWCEVRVGLADGERRLVEYLVPATAADVELLGRLVPEPPPGARVPVQRAAAEWARGACEVLDRGHVVLIDYAATTPEMAARPVDEWLRTYRGHRRGGPPLADLGHQDITCEVAVDQLARVRPGIETEDQGAFLRRHGIDALVEEGRRVWHERGHLGDLEAIKGRSRVNEAAALLDPAGLGAFLVLHWRI